MKLVDVQRFWPQILLVIGFVSACAIIPYKIQATEVRVEKLEEQTQKLADWATATQMQYEMEVQAPPGFIWSKRDGRYIVDPNYKVESNDSR